VVIVNSAFREGGSQQVKRYQAMFLAFLAVYVVPLALGSGDSQARLKEFSIRGFCQYYGCVLVKSSAESRTAMSYSYVLGGNKNIRIEFTTLQQTKAIAARVEQSSLTINGATFLKLKHRRLVNDWLNAAVGAKVDYIFNGGRLEASAKAVQRWRYGTQIIAHTALKKMVFAFERSGRVVGLNAEDGRVLWSTVTGLKPHAVGAAKLTNTTSEIVLASVNSDSRSSSPVIFALRVADGHVLWHKADVCGSNGPAVVAAGLVVWDFTCSGAFTRTELRAFSLQRGKLIWERQALHYGALKRGFLHILGLTADAEVANVERLELDSGKSVTRTYRLTARPGCGRLDSVVDQRLESGALVFFGRDTCGDLEVRIPLR
jgi:PQQ-like domain